jgi:mRNA interferase MazF
LSGYSASRILLGQRRPEVRRFRPRDGHAARRCRRPPPGHDAQRVHCGDLGRVATARTDADLGRSAAGTWLCTGRATAAVVLQHDRFNRTRINTTVVAAITSNLKYGALPGIVRLRRGEGGLPRASIINVTQIATVDRGNIESVAGHLSRSRLAEIWAGVRIVLEPAAE